MKLSIKISILIGVLSFIIALGVGNYANSISSEKLEKNSGESLVKLTKRVADILDREMLERYKEIEFAATLEPLTDENSTKEEKRAYLEKLKGKHNHHEWIGFALPDGTVEAGTSGYLEGKNASARPWLPGGLKGPYIGDVHDALLLAKLLPNNSGEAIYFTDVAFPVKNVQGKTLGVLCTHLMWQWTRDVIRSIQKENSVDIYLLSKDGLILVGPNDSERKNISEVSKNVVNAFTQNETTYKIVNWELQNKYLVAQTVSKGFDEYKGFSWRVIVRQSLDNAYLKANENSNHILIISIIIGLVGALVGVILSNKITSPLVELSNHITDIKNGKIIRSSKVNTKDEISLLEDALIDLSENLKNETNLKNIAQEKVEISLKIFDQSLEGILISDKNNNMILVNKAFTNITGYTQEEVYNKNPNILSSDEQSKEFYSSMWNEILEKGKWEGSLVNKRKDGSKYLENLRISTLKNEQGEIINYFAVFNSGF